MKTSFTKSTLSNKIASLFIAGLFLTDAQAGIIISPSASVIAISADKAANAFQPAYTRLSDIRILEKKSNDFAASFGKSATLVLTAPAGWTFRPRTGSISCNGKDLASVLMTTSRTTISISFKVNGTAGIDALKISGIEVQATDGSAINAEANIYRSSSNPGTAVINGMVSTSIANGAIGTAFAIITQAAGTATKLVFATKPSATAAGAIFEQQPVVKVQDQFGNQTTNGIDANQMVKIKLSSGTGTLSGTNAMNIGTGMASFSDLRLSAPGAKKLIATSGSLTFAVSNEFSLTEDDASPRVSSEGTDDYDPDWICFMQNANSSQAV